jgi:CheY-like chemotaxis protein
MWGIDSTIGWKFSPGGAARAAVACAEVMPFRPIKPSIGFTYTVNIARLADSFAARDRRSRWCGIELDMSGPQPGESVRVALADDDPLARLAIAAMIKLTDWLTLVGGAGSVEEVVNLSAVTRPHVVILDWMMPNGGGPEAARRILNSRPDTGIVALSSSDSLEASLDMMRAGAHCFLVKGGSGDELAHTIRQALTASA